MDGTQAAETWLRAINLHKGGALREAEELYRELLAIPKPPSQAAYYLALIELRTGRPAEARKTLQRGLAINPLNPDIHNAIGRSEEATGSIKQAAASYARAIELRVGHTMAQDYLTRLQATHGYTDADNLVSIVTATTGRPELARAMASVSAQRYRNLQHLIVADGPEAEAQARRIVAAAAPSVPTHLLALPWSIGRDEFHGHRIYAASPHLVNGRFVALLDDDNWLDDDHVSSLVACIVEKQLEWAHSLRKIVDRDGTFLTNDDCQSLGAWESIEAARGVNRPHHVDTNCYLVRRDLAVAHSAIWHRRSQDDAKNPDFLFCQKLMADHKRFATTGRYSLNYVIGARARSVAAAFFLEGNAAMRERYPQGFPWAVRPDAARP